MAGKAGQVVTYSEKYTSIKTFTSANNMEASELPVGH